MKLLNAKKVTSKTFQTFSNVILTLTKYNCPVHHPKAVNNSAIWRQLKSLKHNGTETNCSISQITLFTNLKTTMSLFGTEITGINKQIWTSVRLFHISHANQYLVLVHYLPLLAIYIQSVGYLPTLYIIINTKETAFTNSLFFIYILQFSWTVNGN